jgi:serine/threonine protein kinase/tetratricopeptide (TPR) repeat protein
MSSICVGSLVAGKFRVERALGSGGMGSIYVAVQEPLGRQVALKVIAAAATRDGQRDRFTSEARVVAQLKCPHIVTLHDFGVHEGEPYIVMELLDGETLRARLERSPVPLAEALLIARDLACALRTAHDAGIVHRDLKPENVVLVPDRDRGARAKLLDFGIATLQAPTEVAGDERTRQASVVGTPGYIAPEHILLGRGDDPRIDLYALGVVLFELLTGGPPYAAANAIALVMAHAHDPLPEIPKALGLPADVVGLMKGLLAKDPARRPADAGVVVSLIDQARSHLSQRALATPAAFGPTELLELPIPDRPSIAVQPLGGLGGDEDEAFAEGISEDILTALSCFKQLFVVGVSSMIKGAGRESDVLSVSRTMGVRYVVSGSVRRCDVRVRVNAKLTDGTSGAQVWAQRYDRALHDLFAVQDEVTQSIVSCVAGRLEQAQVELARRKAPHALAAYDWLARGRSLHHRRTLADNEQALAALERALELDPNYAPAHAWRGCVLAQRFQMRLEPACHDPEVISAISRALELDGSDAECHRLASELNCTRDLDRAWSHHERAIALNPNDPRIVGQRGELSMYRGDLDEAVRSLEQAARLDPLAATSYQRHLVCTRYLRRELDEAARLHALLAEARPDMIELGAAIAAMRGDDASRDRALQQLRAGGALVNRPTRPFATDALRRLWREGFERAGISLS